MQILIEGLSLLPPRTGIGRYTESLIKGLNNHPDIDRIETFLSVFPLGKHWNRSIEEIQKIDREISIHRIPLPYGAMLRMWNGFNMPKIDSLYKGFDIVHSPNYVLPPSKNAKGVVTIHDLSVFNHHDWYPKKSRQLINRINKTTRIADLIIVPSHHVKRKLLEFNHQVEDKITIIPYDINSSFYTFNKEEKDVAKKELFGQVIPYLFWVSEINPRKNIPLLFNLIDQMKQKGFDQYKLVLAGPGGYQCQEILAILNQYPKLRFQRGQALQKNNPWDILWLEYVPFEQLKKLYAAADLFVFPSWDEGFGFPVLEAMASGVPVICSNTGSLPEVVHEAAVTANPNQVDNFVESITYLLRDEEQYIYYRKMGLEHIKKFQKNEMINQIVSSYQTLL